VKLGTGDDAQRPLANHCHLPKLWVDDPFVLRLGFCKRGYNLVECPDQALNVPCSAACRTPQLSTSPVSVSPTLRHFSRR
jgi:hypothetical protein